MWSLNTARKELANWRRAIGQSSTYLGLVLIGFIWISLSFHLQVERSSAERDHESKHQQNAAVHAQKCFLAEIR